MCGIAGIVNLKGRSISPITLKRMTDVLFHRGPDGEGQWINENVGLGHRRLAIIDLSTAGHQPMISLDKRWILTYNGEIYNFRELRTELESEGYLFRSNTDSEVVMYALIHWKEKALLKFNGMFALALFDRQEKELFLARDRYGIKPLYYSLQNNIFSFASELKAILEIPSFVKRINYGALLEYCTFQNIFTNQTLFQDIRVIPSGHYAIINVKENSKQDLKSFSYWDYDFSEENKFTSHEEYIEELDRLFFQAVNRQLISDVELGAYLSGGMDSGSITAIASREIENLKSFTCGFDLSSASGIELGFDEREKAEAMSAIFKTEHYEMILKSGDMERCLKKLMWHLEVPRVGQSYPNFYIAKLASKFVKVVLAGTGGDELFGGYPWRYFRAIDCNNFKDYIDHYYIYWQRLINNKVLSKIFKPINNEVKDIRTIDIFKDVFSTKKITLESPKDYINSSLYFECKTFLQGLFHVEDKLSMAYSLETRVPFMDNDLVDFALKCPVSKKIGNLNCETKRINENQTRKRITYFNQTNKGKTILRDMMSRYIPKQIIEANKKGFSSPDASWFKGESIEFVKKRLFDNQSPLYEILDREAIYSVINEHFSGKENRRLFIWSMLNIDEWMRSNGF